MLVSDGSPQTCQSQKGHVGLRRVSQIRHAGLRWIIVSDGSLIRQVGLRYVSKIIIFSWTQQLVALHIAQPKMNLKSSTFKSSRKYYYYRKLMEDPSETDMPDRRPRHASSENDRPHRRPTSPIGDRHAQSETDMLSESNRNFNTLKYSYFYILFAYLYILE